MALRKNVKKETKTITVNVPVNSDLPLKLTKISKQTGLPVYDLIQKWVLQEESMVGLMLYSKNQTAGQTGANRRTGRQTPAGVRGKTETAKTDTASLNYRKTLVKRVKKLKKDGMTLKKIADTFNEEKVSTVSGTGKWYTSSITWLLKLKI